MKTTAAAFALTTLITTSAWAGPSVEGLWEQSDGDGKVGAWFVFERKDDVYVGRLVKGFTKPGEARINTCDKCPGDRKGARMMGLTIVYQMKRDGLHYVDGRILDPRDGSLYNAMMDLSEDGQELSVRGYLMIKALGQTQVWHRLPDDSMKVADIPKELRAGEVDVTVATEVSKAVKHSSKSAQAAPRETRVSTTDKTADSN